MFKTKNSHYPLSNIVDDKFWRSHLDILYLSTQHKIKGIMKKFNINNTLLLLLGV